MSALSTIHPRRLARKSTNVRSGHLGHGAIRLGLRVLASLSPSLTAALARQLMFRVRRFPRPAWEEELLATAARHQRIPLRDGQLWTWSWGEGPPVLLVHGWEGRGTQLGRFIPALLDRGLGVVAFDGPGHGLSTVTRGSMPDQAAAVERLSRILGPFHGTIGHSMGAGSIAYAAAQGVDLGRAVLVAPPLDPRAFFETVTAELGLGERVLARIIEAAEQELGASLVSLNVRDNAGHLRAPAMVVHDREDRSVPLVEGEAVAEACGAELLVTSGLGHRRVLKDAGVIEKVADFLAEG